MTRFVLELKGQADGTLANPGIAQSKVIVGLDPEITALIEKAKSLGLTLTGEPRFVPEHKKAIPANPAAPDPATVVGNGGAALDEVVAQTAEGPPVALHRPRARTHGEAAEHTLAAAADAGLLRRAAE